MRLRILRHELKDTDKELREKRIDLTLYRKQLTAKLPKPTIQSLSHTIGGVEYWVDVPVEMRQWTSDELEGI